MEARKITNNNNNKITITAAITTVLIMTIIMTIVMTMIMITMVMIVILIINKKNDPNEGLSQAEAAYKPTILAQNAISHQLSGISESSRNRFHELMKATSVGLVA